MNRLLANDNEVLSQSEIQYFADQCIAEYGQTSLLARGLIGLIDDQAKGLADICDTDRNSKNQISESSFGIHPSVSLGQFTIDFEKLFEQEGGTLSIYNVNRILILKNDIEKGSRIKHINLSSHPAGIYSVKLQSGNQYIPTQRIIIQKP